MMLNDILMIIFKAVVSIATIIITTYLVPILRNKIKLNADEELLNIISTAVWAAQQTIKDNDEKKSYVKRYVVKWLNEHGIQLTDEQLEMLIESAVLTMKKELK